MPSAQPASGWESDYSPATELYNLGCCFNDVTRVGLSN